MQESHKEKHPSHQFEVDDILDPKTDISADYLLSSVGLGMMNKEQCSIAIINMWENASLGIAFNVPSGWCYDEGLRHDPCGLVEWCRSLSGRIAMRHDFAKHVFNVSVHKE